MLVDGHKTLIDSNTKYNTFKRQVKHFIRFFKPSLLRGRLLSLVPIILSSLSVTVDSGLFLGMYCRNRPLKFSFDPRCQLANGSAKYLINPGVLSKLFIIVKSRGLE